MYHECSRALQPKVALGLITCRPSSACKMGRKISSSSSVSTDLLPCKGRHTLLQRFRRRRRQQSRVNFDSQEDITSSTTKSSDHFTLIKSRRRFSSRKLSIVSCHRNSINYDTPQGSLNLSHANELQGFSRRSTSMDTQKRISFSDPVHGNRCFPNLETKAVSSGHWTVERTSYPPSLTTSLFSLPTVISSSSQVNVSVADSQEHDQLNKDPEDALHHRSQSQSRNYSAAGLEQHLSQNRTSTSLLHDELSSLYQTVNSLTVDVTSGSFREESFATLPLDEDIPSPIEMAEIRSPQIFLSLRRAAHIGKFPSNRSPKTIETSIQFS